MGNQKEVLFELLCFIHSNIKATYWENIHHHQYEFVPFDISVYKWAVPYNEKDGCRLGAKHGSEFL